MLPSSAGTGYSSSATPNCVAFSSSSQGMSWLRSSNRSSATSGPPQHSRSRHLMSKTSKKRQHILSLWDWSASLRKSLQQSRRTCAIRSRALRTALSSWKTGISGGSLSVSASLTNNLYICTTSTSLTGRAVPIGCVSSWKRCALTVTGCGARVASSSANCEKTEARPSSTIPTVPRRPERPSIRLKPALSRLSVDPGRALGSSVSSSAGTKAM
mmetsp:Transcript_119077/g.332241  ORF Transcript_119077/g.332241 Transcript_119077/m.332241 type:complete len:214 (+) Transcript_119077:655-1296(+)